LSGEGSPPDFLALVGPTAAGKTALSLALARELPLEVVSVDSRQVYRGMDVGTAKVGPAERARVPHHGLDLVAPDEPYSAGRFAREARGWIAGIRARGRVPLLVGGTGFFLRALTHPIFREPEMDARRVRALRRWLASQPHERLEAWVRRLDPERAPVAVEGGRQRMGRSLEVALLTGRPLSWWHRERPPDGAPLAGVVAVLELPRLVLDRRIEERAARMLEGGLIEEVGDLLAKGYTEDAPGMSGTGYREVARYLKGEWSLEVAREEIVRATRRYARRQLTWFRRQLPPGAVRVDATLPLEAQAARVVEAWEEETGRGGAV
jgi:tRNA dimethylallyltransferase